jgi:hypothetical protein
MIYYDATKTDDNDALMLYKNEHFMPINTSLRNNRIGYTMMKMIKEICNIIKEQGSEMKEITVYRGITSQFNQFKYIKKDDIIVDNGFLSCSRTLKGAICFSNLILELRWSNTMKFINFMDEDEIITYPMVIIKCIGEKHVILNNKTIIIKQCVIFSNYSEINLNNMFDNQLEKDVDENKLKDSNYYMIFLEQKQFNIVI